MAIQIIGDLLQAIFAGIQLNHLSTGRDALKQAGGVLDPRIDEHHALPRHGSGGRCWRGIGLAVGILAGDRLIGRRCLDRLGGGMAVSLGGVGNRRGHRAVEQHAWLQGHDHWRGQRSCAFGNPRLAFAPPHAAHPDSNFLTHQ